ncbi:serine hydrolase FSH [Colletotrichum lupini]|nr:serine hydrolase FSH [Colletotrichum lupini]
MPCRILCLHGMGINSQIFASQTESFRSLLPSDYDFTFVDGPTTCKPEADIAKVYPGPYLCWYRTPTTESVTAAHRHVKSIMAEKGPFDGIMGFSQGAAVAVSMILRHQLETPSTPPLFKFAILIGSPLPFSHSLMYGIDTRDYFGVSCNVDCSILARYNRPNKVPTYLITPDRYLKDDDDEDFHRTEEACQQPTAAMFYQMFHSTSDEVRMDIPTVHIFGRRDPWYLHSKDVLELACAERASVLEHCYGHEVPRHLSEEICDLIESAVALVEV